MSVSETNAQYICSQSIDRTTLVRLELLDDNYNIVDTLEGEVSEGNVVLTNNRSTSSASGTSSTDSDNDNSNFARISGSLTMVLKKTLTTDYFKLDLKHLVRVVMIITDNISSISAEYPIGICLLNSPTINRKASDSSNLQITLNDLMSLYNGDLGGGLENTVKIESSSNSSASFTQTLQNVATDSDLMNLSSNKIKIESNDFQILSDVTCEMGNNITDLLKALMDLYMGYELFFDKDGVLTYQKIKKYSTDSPIQEFINSPMIVSYTPKEDFTNVRNKIVVWGSTQESSDDESTPIQYSASSELTDSTHPLSTTNIGVKKKVITDEKAQSTEACQSEADYYLEKYTNYAEEMQIELVPDYRLIPNRVIVIEYEDDYITIENSRWLIDNVTINLKNSEVMSITCHKLYS
jgi:hypothetical protein